MLSASDFDVRSEQKNAWCEEIRIISAALRSAGLPNDGWIFFEFDVPRLGTRIDVVIVAGGAVMPIEFKVFEKDFRPPDRDQVWDYGLDLKNFHEGSHDADVFPILVPTETPDSQTRTWPPAHPDGVRPPCVANARTLSDALKNALRQSSGNVIDGRAWGCSAYRPTPTIIQAARALYSRHSVDAIARNDAGAMNLSVTSNRVEEVIDEARATHSKGIVFVTGVPGAGKTLVGLNIATRRRDASDPTHAVFLSGNGPLVAVLREALTRDEWTRHRDAGERVRKGVIRQKVKSFIQNVHHFRDEGLRDEARPPIDHVVIFDEAQRAWNRAKTADFMKRRKKRPGFTQSEPEFLLSYMDRHLDWSVVLCLVGGGQEINTGEDGIAAWLEAVARRFSHWRVYVSPRLADSEYAALSALDDIAGATAIQHDPGLHLSVSMRSFRSESVSNFVKAALDGEADEAHSLLAAFADRYPIVVTRSLSSAKRWVRDHARGSERFGVLASSQAERLKPHAVDVRVDVDPVKWFLNANSDTRSSFYLEDAATEFHVQGLELDWTCMTWDADLRRSSSGWSHHAFRGDRWTTIRQSDRRRYQLNAYRVLLTRARQGMAIFVPPGDSADPTRDPLFYDGTYRYLRDLGLPEIA